MIHELNTCDEFMPDIATGKKTFEVRKEDRNFSLGDHVILNGWNMLLSEYTKDKILALITYKLDGGQFGIKPGYCVLGIKVERIYY